MQRYLKLIFQRVLKTILYLVVKLEEQFRRTERTKSLPKIKSLFLKTNK